MARSKTPAKPAPTTFDVTHTLASAKPASCGDAHTVLVTAYGDQVADRFASKGCHRLPRHEVTEAKGHKAEKPLGLMTPKQRAAHKASLAKQAAKPAAKVASRLVTVGGTKFRVFADGRTEPVVEATVATSKAARIRTLHPVPAERQVAAPAKVTRTRRSVASGQPSGHLA
jgi:hypothetical protein